MVSVIVKSVGTVVNFLTSTGIIFSACGSVILIVSYFIIVCIGVVSFDLTTMLPTIPIMIPTNSIPR